MDLLGIGPLELLFVLILVLLIFGPEDLAKSGKKIGKFLNQMIKSDTWMTIRSVGKEIRMIPTKLAREAEIESYIAENREKTIAPPDKKKMEQTEPAPHSEDIPYEAGLKAWTTPPTETSAGEEK